MTSSPRSGPLSFWSDLPGDGRWLLSTVVVQFFGRGLTLPFTIIYLHEVRGFSLGLSGTLMGLIAVVGLLVTGPAGALVDRYGARRVMLTGLFFAIAGYSVLAFATVPAVAALGLALFGVQLGVGWPSVNALVATVVDGDLRQRYYGVNFALLNLGVGVGGVVGGLVVDIERPATFVMAFLVNAATFVVPVVVLMGPLRHLHGRVDRPDDGAAAEGYLTILRRPEVLWLSGLGLVAAFVGYGQMEGGFPAFARLVAEVSTRAIGFAFVVNTVVIVALQFWVMNRVSGRRRTRVLALMAVVWAAAWLLLGGAGLVPGGTAAVVIVLVFHAFFGLGETLMQSALPALTNEMAPAHLRGRYNAISSGSFQAGTIAGPVVAGLLLERGWAGGFIGVMVVGCLAIVAMAFAVGRRVTPEVDGVERVAVESRPG
ncbi:putative MFS family arabinose efflux permease [Promicromonospora sp. AC04]|uniref:MFS transporter n=1 Tax=Promicromonospora sp. AC04 TaxID=2135723 RepID=UPI000D3869AC|nr:MFS transporter [Promicromonospora sp. AC04]PUB32074.1 putative MFS family arabinose efflux permease [Promicromonospora sp. AC04]